MLLGARQFFEKRGAPAWTNPYVTDGLVAMWDGEWNAGGGVHDPNATVWKDLVAGIELTSKGGHLWAEKSCDVHEVWSCSDKQAKIYFQTNFFDGPTTGGGAYFVEVVSNTTSGNSKNIFGERAITLSIFTYQSYVQAWLGNGNNSNSRLPYNTSGTASFACINDGGGQWTHLCYANGAQTNSLTRTSYYGVLARTEFIGIGLGEYNAWGVAEGDYYCIRLYSRALTAAEIAANYAIDKERFNLP
jgi:hypothetical protein